MNTLAFTLGEHRAQLTLKISTYPNGNLAIKLYEKDHGVLIFWETPVSYTHLTLPTTERV